jgi:hypothetical protein
MPSFALARVLMAVIVGSIAWLLWRRYQRLRPTILHLHGRGRMDCSVRDCGVIGVSEVRVGLVTPWLLSATLRTRDGVLRHLFVPGCSVSEHEHWQLRRFVLAWHGPDEADDGFQSGRRRGT